MPSLQDLPIELLRLVMQRLPPSDVLQMRLVDHHFNEMATPIAFEQITFNLSHLQKLTDMVSFYTGTPHAKFPAKDISISDRKCLSMVATLLPYWRDVGKLSLDFWNGDSNEEQLAILKNVVNYSSLRHLVISYSEPSHPVLPDPGSNLRILDIRGVSCGLECILTLLRNMQHLQSLKIQLGKSSVNETPLCNFVDEFLTSEPPHLSMTNLSITFIDWQKTSPQDVPAVHDVALFFAFLMPKLASFDLKMDMRKSNQVAQLAIPSQDGHHLPPPLELKPLPHENAAIDSPSPLATLCPPLKIDLTLQPNVIHDSLVRLPHSLPHVLTMNSAHSSSTLSLSPVLSGWAFLKKLTIEWSDLLDLDVALQRMPAAACLKELVLENCMIDHPGVLERAVARLSSLSHLHLVCVWAYDWRFDSQLTMNNPWFSLLRSFFKKYHDLMFGEGMLHWFSCPVTTASLHVCEEFSRSEWIGIREGLVESTMQMRLIILIQDAQQATDDLVQMWLYGRVISDYYDPMGTSVAQKLEDADVQMVLTEMKERTEKTRPSFDDEPDFASPAARHAFSLLWSEHNATVYACSSTKKMHLFGPHEYD
ncbi:hypothetical protein BC940DRAFT_353500 [Gongronella butleri]|nr:hypothetical protein BC940DRAFT_353500 [Gongronella butleri]